MYGVYLLVVSFPLLSALGVGFFGKFIGKKGAILVAIPCLALALCIAMISFVLLGLEHNIFHVKLFKWIECGMFFVEFGILLDSLTVSMFMVVVTISMLVHFYSLDYMGHDPHFIRFMSYLSLFTFFMLLLITADNFLQLFLGWEGVGLSSYLLINFWFTRLQANKAAIKAMLMNKVGDFFLGVGIVMIFYSFKSLDYSVVFALVPSVANTFYGLLFFEIDKLSLIGLLLFLGAVGKSAQLGLHTWLPDATEGPTPVSALIHAATMVTAGVFLIIRSSLIFEYTFSVLNIILFIAASTAFFASTVGAFQNDLKRVIAFSTTSQLGYMILACSLSAYSVGMFHLINHAFFKALLFLSSGVVIHTLADEQDMRKMGGLIKLLPFVYISFLIGSLALGGVPFLSGFYSKDIILELVYANFDGVYGYWFGIVAAFFTAFYSTRLLYYTFYVLPNGYKVSFQNIVEISWIMFVPLTVLIIGSIFLGYAVKDIFIGMGSDYWGNAVLSLPYNIYILESEFLVLGIKLLPVIFSASGAFTAYLLYVVFGELGFRLLITKLKWLYLFLNKKWFFDIFYVEWLAKPLVKFGYKITFRLIDRGVIEWLGPYGLVKFINWCSIKISSLNSGYIYDSFLISFIGFQMLVVVILILSYFLSFLTIAFMFVIIFYYIKEFKK
jgi:NADH-ubiquinone oxidoreductase chain 5